LDYPLDVSLHESIIRAYTTRVAHTYIYRVFSVFIICCHILSHDYVYLYSLYRFSCMFSDSDLLIYKHFLGLKFTIIFHILVISCTCMPGPHHLIMYMCACYARHLALFFVLAGVVNNHGFSCPDPGVWTIALLYLIGMAQRESGLAVAYLDRFPSRLFLIGSRDSHLATREYFPVFHIVHPFFVLLSDHTFFRYYLIFCDNCVLVLLLMNCILPLCFRTLILTCTDA